MNQSVAFTDKINLLFRNKIWVLLQNHRGGVKKLLWNPSVRGVPPKGKGTKKLNKFERKLFLFRG